MTRQIGSSNWGAKSLAVLKKDITSELRTRYAISAVAMFAVVTVAAVSFALAGLGMERELQGIFLWLVIYFASLAGLAQSFIKEEESRTAYTLRLYAPASAVFGGKLLFNLLLLFGLELIMIPLYALLVGLEVQNFALFLGAIVLGTIALACSTTLIAAIVAKASVKATLFTVLSFPIVLPLLAIAIKMTQKSLLQMSSLADSVGEMAVLLSYAVVMLSAGVLLFEFVWHEG